MGKEVCLYSLNCILLLMSINCNMQYMCIIYKWSHPTILHCNLLTKGGEENNTIHIQYIHNTQYNTTHVHTKHRK